MKKEVKYIGFYDLPDARGSRVSTLAAVNKMDYIADAIIQAGHSVHLVSPSWASNNGRKTTIPKGGTISLAKNKKVTFCPTLSASNRLLNYLIIIYSLVWLFFWLLRYADKDEKILVYHVQWLSLPIRWAKKIKGFKLILEVEEFYNSIWANKNILHIWEQKLIDSADSYIAVSDVLAKILGPKVQAVVYGNYLLPNLSNTNPFFNNDKINVVYAGSIEDTKGGAYNAAQCAELLPENFVIHILGAGNEGQIHKLKSIINKINTKKERNACIYHGVKTGDVYNTFLLNCHIALNPQKEGKYMNTAFPSKVISYLSHNLRVVSTRIKSIEKSRLSHLITFTNDDKPESFVEAILSINLDTHFESTSKIKELNNEFVVNIKTLLK